jgi:hypothetical protein
MSRRLVATLYCLLLLLACVPVLVQAQQCPGGSVWNGSACVCSSNLVWNSNTQNCACPSGTAWNQNEQKCVSTNPIIRFIDWILMRLRSFFQAPSVAQLTTIVTTYQSVTTNSAGQTVTTTGLVTSTVSMTSTVPTTSETITQQTTETATCCDGSPMTCGGLPPCTTSTTATAPCTFGLSELDGYAGTLTRHQVGSNPDYQAYFLKLTCSPDTEVPLSFDTYGGPFTPDNHIGWYLFGVKGHGGSQGQRFVFFVTSIEGWVLA